MLLPFNVITLFDLKEVHLKTLFYVLCAMTVLAGCARDRDLNPISNVQEAAKDRDLQRTFLGPCSLAGGEMLQSMGEIKGERTVFRFEGNNATRETRYYPNADCSGDAGFIMQENGTFTLDKSKKANDGGYNIDFNWKTVKVIVSTEQGAQAANSGLKPLCGLKDWKKAEKAQGRDVTPQAKDASCYNAAVPRRDYNIYRVDAGTLYLGRTSKANNAPNDRPTKLEGTKYAAK